MFNKFELIGGGISILCMATALYLVQAETKIAVLNGVETAKVEQASSVILVGDGENVTAERTKALKDAVDDNGNVKSMVIDDIKVGDGEAVNSGDVVSVHYVGTLQDGTEFDNSKKRGQPFEFKVGAGQVIRGWEEGLIGMRVGGQRILVIPPEMGYGENGIGPIPGGATLVFAIELLETK